MSQLELSLPDPDAVELHFRRLEQLAALEFSPENLCVAWACQGNPDHDWWKGLPEYKRREWVNRYELERWRADTYGCAMRSPATVLAMENEAWQEHEQRAQAWAVEIREAFKAGKPCPIRPTFWHQHTLDRALDLAAIPAACVGL